MWQQSGLPPFRFLSIKRYVPLFRVQIARNVLAVVAVFYVPSVGVQLYGEIGRLDRVVAAKTRNGRF
jgi:hypothetical protein